jgi:4-hydroxybenzoate polyprenyltransferase
MGLFRLGLVFFSTLFIYIINTNTRFNLLSIFRRPSVGLELAGKHNRYALIIALIIVVLLFFMPIKEVLLLGHLGILAMLYNPPDNAFGFHLPLRAIPFLKIFLITYVWSVMGLVYPWFVLERAPFSPLVLHLLAAFVFFILGITLPFDIRDYHQDKAVSIRTVVHLFGIPASRVLAVICVLISFAFLYPSYKPPFFLMVPMIWAIALILMSNPHRHPLYYQVFLDSTILILYFATILTL